MKSIVLILTTLFLINQLICNVDSAAVDDDIEIVRRDLNDYLKNMKNEAAVNGRMR